MNELLSWGLTIFVSLGLVALGFNALQVVTSGDEFWIARGWFVLAAIVLLVRFIIWGIFTPRSLTIRLIVCIAACGLITATAVEAVRYINRKHDHWVKSQQVPPKLPSQPTSKATLTSGEKPKNAQAERLPTTKVVEIAPNIVALEPEPCIAHIDEYGVIVEGEIKYYHGGSLWWGHDHFIAITVPYRNRLLESKETGEIYGISAQITYQFYDGQTRPYEMPRAAWLSEEESYVDFPRDATNRLIIATFEDGNNEPPRIYGVSRDSFGTHKGRETRRVELLGVLFGVQVSLRSETKGKVVKTSDYMLEIKHEPEFDFSLKPALLWKRDKLADFGLEATDIIKRHEQGASDESSEKEFDGWKAKVGSFLTIHLSPEHKKRFLPEPYVPPITGRPRLASLVSLEPVTFEQRVLAKVKLLQSFIEELRRATLR
jgi:hypothetical protein